jgi:hypothetical protein
MYKIFINSQVLLKVYNKSQFIETEMTLFSTSEVTDNSETGIQKTELGLKKILCHVQNSSPLKCVKYMLYSNTLSNDSINLLAI